MRCAILFVHLCCCGVLEWANHGWKLTSIIGPAQIRKPSQGWHIACLNILVTGSRITIQHRITDGDNGFDSLTKESSYA